MQPRRELDFVGPRCILSGDAGVTCRIITYRDESQAYLHVGKHRQDGKPEEADQQEELPPPAGWMWLAYKSSRRAEAGGVQGCGGGLNHDSSTIRS